MSSAEKEQEEEEKRLLRLQEEREHRLKKEGWVSLGLMQVNAVANAQVCQLWSHLLCIFGGVVASVVCWNACVYFYVTSILFLSTGHQMKNSCLNRVQC